MIGTDSQSSPITDYFDSLGYSVEGTNGDRFVKNFSSVNEELNSLNDGVGMRDISNSGIFELKGNDVLDFLQRITTNSVKTLEKEKVVETIITSEKGRVIDNVKLLNFVEYQLMITNPANKAKVKSWIEKYIIMDDVKITNASDRYILLELLGPQCNSFVTLLAGGIPGEMDFNRFKVVHSDGIIFFIVKLKFPNEANRFWLLADPFNGQKLIKNMKDYNGPFDFNFIGAEAYNIYRIEKGIPAAPNEITALYNPLELNMVDRVDFKKGCYIGQEVIARLDTYDKVQKKLTSVVLSGNVDPNEKYNLTDKEGKEAGQVTSVVYSDHFKLNIGLAMVRNAYIEKGTILTGRSEKSNSVKVIVGKP